MDRVQGPGGGSGIPEDAGRPANPPPGAVPGGGATPRAVNPALANAPSTGAGSTGSRRASFSAPGGIDPAALSRDLANRAMNVRTLAHFEQVLSRVRALPPEHQLSPLYVLEQSIENIAPQKHRFDALKQLIAATSNVRQHADCGAIVTSLPYAASVLAPGHQEAGYRLVSGAILNAESLHMHVRDRASSLSGLTYLLTNVRPSDAQVQHAAEVTRILQCLEPLPVQRRMPTLLVLCERRFALSQETAELIARDALQASVSDEFGSDRRMRIAHALIDGLAGMSAGDPRFDGEFVRLFQASRGQTDSQVRMSMLNRLSGYLDRLSPEPAEKMRGAIHSDLVELGNANPAGMDSELMRNIEQIFALIGERDDPSLSKHPDPIERANLMAALAENLHELPNIDLEGPMTNARVKTYMRLGATMLEEMKSASGEHEQAILRVNELMIRARQSLKPGEIAAIDQMLRDNGYTPGSA